jgi:phage repressor protein C with HTH and peptisase S24 domain
MSISERIKLFRSSNGLKQEELAAISGIPLDSLRKYEGAKSDPGAKAIEGLTRAGINANWLLTGEGPMLLQIGAALGLALKAGVTGASISVDKLLEELAVSPEQMRTYQDGSCIPERAFLQRFAELTGYSFQKLETLHELANVGTQVNAPLGNIRAGLEPRPMPSAEGYVAIPLFNDVRAAAGTGALNGHLEKADDALMFKEDWVRFELGAHPEDLNLIRVSGDSMEPTLRAGDVVLIDHRAQRPNREGIYILRMGDMLLVKRLQALPGGKVRVISDNPIFEAWVLDLAEMGSEVSIVGRVVWSGRRL